MHNALSYTRTHNPKTAITGLYSPNEDTTTVDHPTGPHFKTIGKADSQGRLHLFPEEALYLVERGSLDLRWTGVEELEGLPMSLQAAYAYMIGSKGLTLERYVVYSGLKRNGYVVQRAPTWYREDHGKVSITPRRPPETEPLDYPPPQSYLGILYDLYTSLFTSLLSSSKPSSLSSPPDPPPPPPPEGPLVQPGLYRSYAPIYQRLALIPFHDPTNFTPRERAHPDPTRSTSHLTPDEIIRPAFNVWKPSQQNFKKTSPPPPDFHIAVLDARQDPFPTYEQLDDLLQCMPYTPPVGAPSSSTTQSAEAGSISGGGSSGGGNGGGSGVNQIYARLRYGYRHVILAVVDQGIVSYVRIGDAGFGMERVWERHDAQLAQRKKGGGGGGNRGGGRGGKGNGGGRGGGHGGGQGGRGISGMKDSSTGNGNRNGNVKNETQVNGHGQNNTKTKR